MGNHFFHVIAKAIGIAAFSMKPKFDIEMRILKLKLNKTASENSDILRSHTGLS